MMYLKGSCASICASMCTMLSQPKFLSTIWVITNVSEIKGTQVCIFGGLFAHTIVGQCSWISWGCFVLTAKLNLSVG